MERRHCCVAPALSIVSTDECLFGEGGRASWIGGVSGDGGRGRFGAGGRREGGGREGVRDGKRGGELLHFPPCRPPPWMFVHEEVRRCCDGVSLVFRGGSPRSGRVRAPYCCPPRRGRKRRAPSMRARGTSAASLTTRNQSPASFSLILCGSSGVCEEGRKRRGGGGDDGVSKRSVERTSLLP